MRTDTGPSIDRIVSRGGNARGVLRVAADQRGETLANLSRILGRHPGYLTRYVNRGLPIELPRDDRCVLARYLGISDALLV